MQLIQDYRQRRIHVEAVQFDPGRLSETQVWLSDYGYHIIQEPWGCVLRDDLFSIETTLVPKDYLVLVDMEFVQVIPNEMFHYMYGPDELTECERIIDKLLDRIVELEMKNVQP